MYHVKAKSHTEEHKIKFFIVICRLMWSLHSWSAPTFNNLLIKINEKSYNSKALEKHLFVTTAFFKKQNPKHKRVKYIIRVNLLFILYKKILYGTLLLWSSWADWVAWFPRVDRATQPPTSQIKDNKTNSDFTIQYHIMLDKFYIKIK